MTIPPSHDVTGLTGWKEKTARSSWSQQPTGRPSGCRAPSEWAASAMSATSSPTAARISCTGAGSPAKSTGITTRAGTVLAVSALMFSVAGSMSAKAGSAPRYTLQLALAANVRALVSEVSPGPTPAANAAPCRAAVPDENATAWGTSQRSATASSKAVTEGPWVSQSPARTSVTRSTSRASTDCRP